MNTLPKSIFEVWGISHLLSWASKIMLTVFRFKYRGIVREHTLPEKFVLIGAPHTSSIDVPIMLMVACALELPPVFWTAKKELFVFPFGYLLKWLGGIPVDRSTNNKAVEQLAYILSSSKKRMCMMFAPEGTRSGDGSWRTGFYYTAVASHVPIVLGYLDYRKSRGGIASLFDPTGDVEGDISHMRKFYDPIRKRNT